MLSIVSIEAGGAGASGRCSAAVQGIAAKTRVTISSTRRINGTLTGAVPALRLTFGGKPSR
jgi:hypothetical protein